MGAKKGKRKRLEAALADIRLRWGPQAIGRGKPAGTAAQMPHIPTGFPALDKALGIGGIPRGRLTELNGRPTSGMTTLALKLVANAQAEGDTAVYLDLGRTFNADYAHRCQVDVSEPKLLLVRPQSGRDGLAIARTLVASRSAGILIVDSLAQLLAEPQGQGALSAALGHLNRALAKSSCALIFLTPLQTNPIALDANPHGSPALAHYATLRLVIEKEGWLRQGRDIRGYRAQVKVVKNKLGPAGKKATIRITFNGTVRGDGL